MLTGHYQYYAVPRNSPALTALRHWVERLWYRALRRRSQKTAMTWQRLQSLARQWLPIPRILHPYPGQRLRVIIQGKSPVR